MKNNPFLNNKGIADNENTQNPNIKNPFIEEKIKADKSKESKKRKSILFFIADFAQIVALSKTKGETYTGLINSLVEKEIDNLNEYDKKRFDNFLK